MLIRIEDIYKEVKDREESAYADKDLSEISQYADLAIQLKLTKSINWDDIFKKCNQFVSKWPESHIKAGALSGLIGTKEKLLGANTPAK